MRRIRLFATQFAPAHNFRVPVTSYIMSVWRGNVEIAREFGVGLNNSSPCNRCIRRNLARPARRPGECENIFFAFISPAPATCFLSSGSRAWTNWQRDIALAAAYSSTVRHRHAARSNNKTPSKNDTPDGKQRLSNWRVTKIDTLRYVPPVSESRLSTALYAYHRSPSPIRINT